MFIFDSRTSVVCVTAIKFIDVGWGEGQFYVLPKYCKLILSNSVGDLYFFSYSEDGSHYKTETLIETPLNERTRGQATAGTLQCV